MQGPWICPWIIISKLAQYITCRQRNWFWVVPNYVPLIHLSCYILDENVCLFDNITYNEARETVKEAGIKDEALLSGDLNALERFVYNNKTEVQLLCCFYTACSKYVFILCCSQRRAQYLLLLLFTAMGMVEAVRLCLKSGFDPGEVHKLSGEN